MELTKEYVVICAILSLAAVECVALVLGYNGQLQRLMMIIIAGLAGYVVPAPKIK